MLNRGCTISEANQHLLPQREHLYLGLGRAQLSRKGMFRASSGLAVCMEQRVFDMPPINGAQLLLLLGASVARCRLCMVRTQQLAPGRVLMAVAAAPPQGCCGGR